MADASLRILNELAILLLIPNRLNVAGSKLLILNVRRRP